MELEIFAPYGLSYRDAAVSEPVINYIGFSTTNNALRQGLNMIAIPRILSFDPSAPSLTLGISVYIKSVYFSQYLFPNKGRASVPKGSIVPDEDTICMDFVSGELLDYEIKPLELGPPKCEEKLKKDCAFCTPCCSSVTQGDETGTPFLRLFTSRPCCGHRIRRGRQCGNCRGHGRHRQLTAKRAPHRNVLPAQRPLLFFTLSFIKAASLPRMGQVPEIILQGQQILIGVLHLPGPAVRYPDKGRPVRLLPVQITGAP